MKIVLEYLWYSILLHLVYYAFGNTPYFDMVLTIPLNALFLYMLNQVYKLWRKEILK
jgi:hypothetical protein